MDSSKLLQIKKQIEEIDVEKLTSDDIRTLDSISQITGFIVFDWDLSQSETEE